MSAKGVFGIVSAMVVLVLVVGILSCTKPAPSPAAPGTQTPTATAPVPTAPKPAATTAAPSPTAAAKPTPTVQLPPRVMTWTAYDIGSGGYSQAAAVGEGLLKKYGTKLRVIPAGEDISRLIPARVGTAEFALTGFGSWQAAQGTYMFSSMDWGPQPVKMLWQKFTPGGSLAATKTSGIKTPYDLKGKRVGWVPGSTNNILTTAIMAFGNVTWADVKRVEFPSYTAELKGLIEGKVDAAGPPHTTVPVMYELETSPRGLQWVELPHSDTEAWARLNKIWPFAMKATASEGAGVSKDKPAQLCTYPYPNLAAYPWVSDDLAYWVTKAIHETYPLYKDITNEMPPWKLEEGIVPAGMLPYHPASVKYFKEIGHWNDKLEAYNKKAIAEQEALAKAWETALAAALDKGIKGTDFAAFWLDNYRAKIPGVSPAIKLN